jgi:tRNA-dihydrouridine synthase A
MLTNDLDHRISVAPMMDWTDRHCRRFHRLLTKHTRLYTEMVTTGALLHGDQSRHLDFSGEEQPLALHLGALWGYDEINLNCGCPSERVQRGSFGACLMSEPKLVAACVKAMVDKVMIPVTVKHRIGIDSIESYDFVRDFVGTVADAGCGVFIVHARNAILKGLSPKQNREVPPLKYEYVYQLKRDFPQLTIVLNGGVCDTAQAKRHLQHVDGVMLGREAYQNPYWLANFDRDFFADPAPQITREAVEAKLAVYAAQQAARGVPRHSIMRHTLGLYRGLPGARAWRRSMSQQPVWAA